MLINIHLNPRTLLVFSALLSVFCLLVLVSALRQWHSDWVLIHPAISPTSVIKPAIDSEKTLAAAERLFGGRFSRDGTIPLSQLQLQITGIVKSSTGHSKAYISLGGEPSKIYQVGDHLPYGVKIYAIHADAVILDNGGHLESLLLQREKLQFKARGLSHE